MMKTNNKMSNSYKFDTQKAIEVLLYIACRTPNMYHALKILYFADKDHLTKYGRSICGDKYVAMRHGPVPSGLYDLIKYACGDGYWRLDISITDIFRMKGNIIQPLRESNLDILSESDIECLDRAIQQYGDMPFGRLKQLSHDDRAFKEADENDFIPLKAIIESLPDGDLLLDYLLGD